MRARAANASLIGREAHLDALCRALAEAAAGDTRTVVIGGEAGIGKTRLIDEFARKLPAGTILVRGYCIDLGRDAPPYGPVTGALRAVADEIGADTLLTAAGPSRDALLVVLPELEPHERADDEPRRGGAERLYDGVALTLESVARTHPLVLVIEDLHWADQGTLGMLRFLVRVLAHARTLFVFTYRSDDMRRGHQLRAWLPELDRSSRVRRRDLERLTRPQVQQLMGEILGTEPAPHDVNVVYQRSDGVPFFIEELVDFDGYENSDCFPDTLREILLARYDTLGDEAQRMLRLIAAGGSRVEHALLAAVHEGKPDDIDRSVREAVVASVLVVNDTGYAFRHSLVREAIHEELLPGERVRFHSQYARALESGIGSTGTAAIEISHHWMAAHDVRRAFAASLPAMTQARRSFAYATAARMGERALELWSQVPDAAQIAGRSRVDILGETAHHLRNAGESDRAISLVDAALAESEPTGSAAAGSGESIERYARLLRDKASYLANVGRSGSVELLRQALTVLRGQPPSVLRAAVLGELAARLMLNACLDESVGIADEAFTEAEAVGSRARMSVSANIRGMALLERGEIERGLADLALAGGLAVEDSSRLRYWVNMSDAMFILGRFEEALQIAEVGAEGARSRGVERTAGAILVSNMIGPLLALGEWSRADALLDRALELDPPIGFSAHLKRLKLGLILGRGEIEQADRLLRGWRAALSLQVQIDAQSRMGLARVAGEIAVERGDPEAAWAEVSLLLDPDHRPLPAYDLPLLALAARTLAELTAAGDLVPGSPGATDAKAAEQRLRAVLAHSASWPTAAVWIRIFDAELGGPGHTGTDPELWGAAVTAAEAPTSPAYLRPYTIARLAEALAMAGHRADAHAKTELARTLAREMGAELIVARVEKLERRAGLATATRSAAASASASGAAPEAPDDGSGNIRHLLTERERQVLELVAEGYTNRQIAEHLFISAKTASVHVSSILRKLGASSRTEAVFLARRSGAV